MADSATQTVDRGEQSPDTHQQPTPPRHRSLLTDESDRVGFLRVERYLQYCDTYRVRPYNAVCIALRYPFVTHLELNSDFIVGDIAPLCDILRFDNVIQMLDCSAAKPLGNSGCYALANALLANRTLVELNLDYQAVGDQGAVILAASMEKSRLQRVYLRGNRIGVTGAIALARLLRKTKTLAYLDVSNNYLRVRGVNELTRALIMRAQSRMSANWAEERRAELNNAWLQHMQANVNDVDMQQTLPLPHIPEALRPRPKPISGILAGAGLGWLWGNASDLVVTSNYVVRTNFNTSFPFSGSAGDVHAPSSEQKPSASSSRRRPSGDGSSERARSRSSSSGSLSQAAGDSTGSDAALPAVDIEVRISGNFVQEEVFNSIVHGLGLVLSLIGAFPLLSKASANSSLSSMNMYNNNTVLSSNYHLLGCLIYVAGLIAFFGSSTLNHSLFLTDASKVFRLVDHSAVYLLIAGTYTPFLLCNTAHLQPLSGGLLAGVWILAAIGIAVSTLSSHEDNSRMMHVRMLLYGLMGYLGIAPCFMLYACIAPTGWGLLAMGGLIFSFGVVSYIRRNRSNPHVVHSWWYVFVVLACMMHWFAIYTYVQPSDCNASEFAHRLGLVWASSAAPPPSSIAV